MIDQPIIAAHKRRIENIVKCPAKGIKGVQKGIFF
jgi:hypothetical protein